MTLTHESLLRDVITAYLRQFSILVDDGQRTAGTLKRTTIELHRAAPELRPARRRGVAARWPWRGLGDRRLCDLEVCDVVAWVDEVQECSTEASACTSLRALRALLYWARRRGLLRDNPAANLGITHEPAPGEPFSVEEVAALEAVLGELEARAVAFAQRLRPGWDLVAACSVWRVIRFLLMTGARLEEGSGLRRDELRLAQRHVYKRRSKTGPRVIPLSPEAQELLERQVAELGGRSEHVFPSPICPGFPISTAAVADGFGRAMEVMGLRRHVHDLRHTWFFFALCSGYSIDAVAKAGGHRNAKMTLKVYGGNKFLTTESLDVAHSVQEARHGHIQVIPSIVRKEVPDVAA